ncbi:ferredoxin reductase family protein [Aestuariimicrobium soli]|uniref:ferredoxin reductase family protein n=1 Tax=Aestuariimicrobium soli TaxID=2035834 RepID=UPI003EBB7994
MAVLISQHPAVKPRVSPRPPSSGATVGEGIVRAVGWVLLAAAVAVFLAGRTAYGWDTVPRALTSLGAIAGLVAMTLFVMMVALAARIPVVDRAIGHDGALRLHRELGLATFAALGAHVVLLVSAWAATDGGWLAGLADLWGTTDVALAIAGTGLALVVGLTSVAAARAVLPREVWHLIHLASYAAIGLAVPHQFTTGGLLSSGLARDYWVVLLSATAAAVVAFRVVRPLVASFEQGLRVVRVRPVSRDAVEITMTGRHLDRLGAAPGQFLGWRFWAPGLWWHPHPFSLSSAPNGHSLSITVRALGRGTSALQRVPIGTRVSVEGPFGRFTPRVRTRRAVVLAGAGVGLAPLKSLLEALDVEPGRSLVLARGSRPDDLVHLDEIAALCRAKGARLEVLVGPRGPSWTPSWAPVGTPAGHLGSLAPWLPDSDLYVCGPPGWTQALIDEATLIGLDPAHIHHERFSW